MAQTTIEHLDSMAMFSFSIMSDNKGYALENPHMYKCDQWIRAAGDRFILGLGDHVKRNRANPFLDLIQKDSLWHHHFYPNVADGENEYFGKGQGDWGAGFPILEAVDLWNRKNIEIRKNKCEYYAIEKQEGIKIHIIQLHYSDTPRLAILAFRISTRRYLKKILSKIDKSDKDIIVVLAHTDKWIKSFNKKNRTKLMNKVDLILDATTHRFKKYSFPGNKSNNSAIAFNTGAVGNSADNGFIQVHVLKNPLRMIIQYQRTANQKRGLQKDGFAYEKIINGEIREMDWKN